MKISATSISDLCIIKPDRFEDERGFFSETWNKRRIEEAGYDLPEFVQDNHSMSLETATLRGLHFQAPPHPQGKLVRCGRGRIFDVAVDVRKGSPTYGHWHGEELSFANGIQLWIPAGFLHGFLTLERECEIIYKCTDYYDPVADGAVAWDSVGIDWPLNGFAPIVSDKDRDASPFSRFDSPFIWESN